MTPDDARALQAAIRALHRAGRRGAPAIAGVSRAASRLLGAIARRGDAEVRPGGLAEDLGMTTSNVAAALRELEAEGYIERRRADADARQVLIRLTEHGLGAVEQHRSLKVDALREAIDASLTPAEQAQVVAVVPILQRLAAEGSR
jgi:DNA-binding MarR family transcriptional regulator